MSSSLLAAAGRLRSVFSKSPCQRIGSGRPLLLSGTSNQSANRFASSATHKYERHAPLIRQPRQQQKQQQLRQLSSLSSTTTSSKSTHLSSVSPAVAATVPDTSDSSDQHFSQDAYYYDDRNTDSESDSGHDSDDTLPKNKRKSFKRNPEFTPEIDEEIIRLRTAGESWGMIASKVARPQRSCHRRFLALLDPSLQEFWTPEKLTQLDQLVAQGKSWVDIGKEIGILSTSCQLKWRSLARTEPRGRNRQFDHVQSKVLLELVAEHGEDDWKLILRAFMIRLGGKDMAKVTTEQLRHQYYRLKRKPVNVWTVNDETAVIQHVLKNGPSNWETLSEALGADRHPPESCREKWLTMDMKVHQPKVRAWYKAERGNFWRLWLKFGSDWKTLSDSLYRRTPEQCEDYFRKATEKFDKGDPEKYANQLQSLAKEMSSYNTIIWKPEESDRLWAVAEECKSEAGRVIWSKVAEKMNMGISAEQYKHHHYYLKLSRGNQVSNGPWTEEELQLLEKAVLEVGRKWKLVSKLYMPHRNSKSLCHKYQMLRIRGQHISPEDYDALLVRVDAQEEEHRRRYGLGEEASLSDSSDWSPSFTPNWERVAEAMPGRGWTPKKCKETYEGSFRTRINASQWSEEDDLSLKKAVEELGRKNWIGVADRFTGKDAWQCRLRWSDLQEPIVKTRSVHSDGEDIKDAGVSAALHTPSGP
ncbi:hypothetical protein EMPS_05468 [Entomortierella parvispora]|uniref:Uncharacterized protein n=1 Tax=Entomortierella parvispora TaxID=205924 RepID=A0A9P3HAG4_9FUNG|nr:hypothetical protein EMPS_05468 [Entomortierella parvispora]